MLAGTVDVNGTVTAANVGLSIAPAQTLCAATASLDRVSFGDDRSTACMLLLTQADFAGCAGIRAQTEALLLTPQAAVNIVGKFGNSNASNGADWTPLATIDSGAGADAALACGGVAVGVELQLLTARVGPLASPQNTIVGARRVVYRQTLQYLCTGTRCSPGAPAQPQPAMLFTRVRFVDVTQVPQTLKKDPPDVVKKVPSDFFYPFN